MQTSTIIVCASPTAPIDDRPNWQDRNFGVGEGCPRSYVTGETVDTALQFADSVAPDLRSINTLAQLRTWVADHSHDIDAHPAAWCAIELAILDALAKREETSVESLLRLPEVESVDKYSAVLGDGSFAQFHAQARQYVALAMPSYKLKLSEDLGRDVEKIASLLKLGVRPEAIRGDANNLWSEPTQCIAHVNQLPCRLRAIEEPLAVRDFEGLRNIYNEIHAPLILDESCLRIEDLEPLRADCESWIINVRVSKMGGLLRSLALCNRAIELGISLIVGAQVGETSLLTRAALTLNCRYIDHIVACEGAFSTFLIEDDPFAPNVRFGSGGTLDISNLGLSRHGFGLASRLSARHFGLIA